MGRIIAVTNLKGGIGKTTTVVNVGAGLALKGARVLLVDVDAQGNLAVALGVQPRRTLYEVLVDGANAADCITSVRPGLDMLAADESLLSAQPTIARRPDWSRVLEQALRPITRSYDFILIDCGGSLTVLNINALLAASDLLVPTAIEHLSIKGLELLFKQVTQVKGNTSCIRLIVPTMFDPRLRQAGTLLEHLQTTYGSLVTAPIRVNVRLSEAPSMGRTIYEYDPRSRGAADYAQLVERLSELWQFKAPPTVARPVPLPKTNGAIPPNSEPVNVSPSVASVEPAVSTQSLAAERALVMGSGALQMTCPNCGRPLQRATVAGYRVAYCDNCKYRHQELAAGVRR